ncbi:hypothetical protein GCM10007094_36640 [Pseudovibrio japonicus]|uniref:Uncharacterized protein n=2 Tax=Pseudovibrio japonicus TaxID=366534 RepID=A0ABQ3EKA4_9HYPH|nr:hypothetical protein GCM10007094_36640 [Pseudovibrio japonicus]
MANTTKDIFVISCSILGDQNNLLGLAKALANEFGGKVRLINIKFRSRVLEALYLRLLQQKNDGGAWDQIASWFCVGDIPAREEINGAFVISTLGAGEIPAAYLSKLGAFSIHLGELKRVPNHMIDMVISHPGHITKASEYRLPCAPSQINHEELLPHDERNDLLVAFGGDAGSLIYSTQFYEKVLLFAASIAEENQLSLKITTSHRTGTKNERVIQEYINKNNLEIEQLVLFNRGDRASMSSLLNNAAAAIVSAESVSMVSEALTASAKTLAVFEQSLPKERRITQFLEEQSSTDQILLVDAINTPRIDLKSRRFPSVSWRETFLAAVHNELNKKVTRTAA